MPDVRIINPAPNGRRFVSEDTARQMVDQCRAIWRGKGRIQISSERCGLPTTARGYDGAPRLTAAQMRRIPIINPMALLVERVNPNPESEQRREFVRGLGRRSA